MSSIMTAIPATRHYKIFDEWLDEYQNDRDRYVDINEIRMTPNISQYLKDLISMKIISAADIPMHQGQASFIDNAIITHYPGADTDHDYLTIKGILSGEIYTDIYQLAPIFPYTYIFSRIYAHDTTARKIFFLGYGHKAYDGTDLTTINPHGIVR